MPWKLRRHGGSRCREGASMTSGEHDGGEHMSAGESSLRNSASRRMFLQEGAGAVLLTGVLAPLAAQAATVGDNMVWLPKAEVLSVAAGGTDAAFRDAIGEIAASAMDTYPDEFVAYLARFLLTYDTSCRQYYRDRVAKPRTEAADVFRGFAASVVFGLDRYTGAEGVRTLGDALAARYAFEPDNADAQRQLGLLFAMLPAPLQPLSLIETLSGVPARSPSEQGEVSAKGGGWDLGDVLRGGSGVQRQQVQALRATPTALLPSITPLRYDAETRGYKFATQGEGAAARAVLRAQAPSPRQTMPVKERRLLPPDFALFALCGALGCTVTHAGVIPLDVVKTRMQTAPAKYTALPQVLACASGETVLAQDRNSTELVVLDQYMVY
ncbi:hypothetical protein JKP88DRAFT_323443 [Tribonema minus]|uniref:Uncharacterized protein n=1 Tax=Tribonema minus TaxID=303371 RepID=A0A835YSB1_9STRA|nr:hypothetical protein JKP88DRAFT_323443 [Tribonema minus]